MILAGVSVVHSGLQGAGRLWVFFLPTSNHETAVNQYFRTNEKPRWRAGFGCIKQRQLKCMASRIHQQLISAGFSERFLRTTAGNHPSIRSAIARHPDLWQPCRGCSRLFVLTTRIPEPCLNKDGVDVRGNATRYHSNSFCSSHCAEDVIGGGPDVYKRIKAMELARRKDFYETKEWRELRYQAFAINGNRCQCCGRSPREGAVMHVDHIKPRFWNPELALELSNLQVLCEQCNRGKGMHDDADWREVS